MNIFEALEKGGGRATLPGVCTSRFITKRLVWIGEIAGFKHGWDGISGEDLNRNDWIPYVPRGTLGKFYTEICPNCESVPNDKKVLVTVGGKCVYCDRQVILYPKAKRTEVFENVKWKWNNWADSYAVYPDIDIDKKHSFLGKPPMKMTLEWEE